MPDERAIIFSEKLSQHHPTLTRRGSRCFAQIAKGD